ncbi:MAG TPA: rhodanese-like domain-containing protein, partial [Planctomycetota bacterium]|nr:rhodanese-like domain-containing protein [Planctomycetota bacterium]
MRHFLLLLALTITLPLAAEEMKHTTDTIDQVKTAVSSGTAVLVDVREQDEWDKGHLKVASLLPLSLLKKEGAEIPATLPKDKPIYLHCKAGGRCLKAAEILKAKGYDVR